MSKITKHTPGEESQSAFPGLNRQEIENFLLKQNGRITGLLAGARAALVALEIQPVGGEFTQEQAITRRDAKRQLRAAIATAEGGAQ